VFLRALDSVLRSDDESQPDKRKLTTEGASNLSRKLERRSFFALRRSEGSDYGATLDYENPVKRFRVGKPPLLDTSDDVVFIASNGAIR